MGINYPSRPPVGQKYPDPPIPDVPTWQWNGTAWVQISGGGGGGSGAASGITFAPGGNISATDVQAAILELDTEKIAKAGDTMTGLLVLSADPGAPLGAATKQYVDAHAGGGNVSNSGAPTSGQYAKWVTGTTIQGVTPATVLSDIAAAPLTSPALIGTPTAPTATAGTNTTQLATTAYVLANSTSVPPATVAPIMDSVAAVGIATKYAREDHVHPSDTTRAALTQVVRYDAAQTLTAAQQIQARSNIAVLSAPQGRLTLLTGVPVMVTTQSAKTTLYYTPYQGNQVPIYDGTSMQVTAFAEISVLTTDTAKNPAAIGASKVNDWFVWNDAGTLRLSHGPDWTSDSARSAGSALIMVNGIMTNAVAITNGPAISRGTWVGTTRSNASSQLDWIYGGNAAGGTAGFFGIWNSYNRRLVNSQTIDTTGSRLVAAGVLEPLLNSTSDRTSYVCGVEEDIFTGRVAASINSTGSTAHAEVFIGYDALNAKIGLLGISANQTAATASPVCCEWSTTSAPGFHFMQAMAFATAAGGVTFYGSTVFANAGTGHVWQGMM